MKSMIFIFLGCLTIFSSVDAMARRGGRDRPRQTVDYMIPTEDPALERFAHYSFNIKWENTSPGSRSFEYDLPVTLDGIGHEIHLREVEPGHFEGGNATALCESSPKFTCAITYRDLNPNVDAAMDEIASRFLDEEEAAGKLQVMKLFTSSTEPKGILTVLE